MARWAVISTADNGWLRGPLDDEPAAGEAERVIPVVAGFPDTCLWSADRNGFVDVVGGSAPITSAGFMLLLAQPERIAIRGARASDAMVEDFWEMVAGSSAGIVLTDAWVAAGVQHLVSVNLLTADRAAALLAGTAPQG